jgi:hypothetical protein
MEEDDMRLKPSLAAACVLIAGFAWGVRPTGVRAADPQFSTEYGLQYETGDYGTGETTTTWTAPLTLKYYPNQKLDFELYVPFIRTSNASTTVIAGGMRGRRGGSQGSVRTMNSETGLGDVSLTTGYNLIPESAHTVMVRPLFYVKLPTGDEDKGLGTGGLDVGGGLALSKWLGDWMTYGELFYISPENSDNLDLQDYWNYTFTLGYAATDRLRPEVSLVGSTNAFKGADDVRSLELALNYWPAGRFRLLGYVSFGLTNASSDFSTGASIAIF